MFLFSNHSFERGCSGRLAYTSGYAYTGNVHQKMARQTGAQLRLTGQQQPGSLLCKCCPGPSTEHHNSCNENQRADPESREAPVTTSTTRRRNHHPPQVSLNSNGLLVFGTFFYMPPASLKFPLKNVPPPFPLLSFCTSLLFSRAR